MDTTATSPAPDDFDSAVYRLALSAALANYRPTLEDAMRWPADLRERVIRAAAPQRFYDVYEDWLRDCPF